MAWIPPQRRASLTIAAVAILTSVGGTAFAQQPEVTVKLLANQVVTRGEKESLVPADKAKPGDVIEYKAVYANAGKTTATNVAATVPVPAGLALLPDSAQPAAASASVDGKTFAPVPLTRRVKNSAGLTEEVQVPPAEYRALRWQLSELPAGATTAVALRARVLSNGSN